ncbi:MAG TPA: hypothetical protein VMS56_15990, partial [Thermoanaerobaculia bacterium]|nr:hypothetical protein [Thermoanaerobaculia bacterium]
NGVYINSKWSYNVTGLYQIPVVEMNFGFSILGREGYPIPYVHSVGTSEGTKNILLQGIGEERHDDPFLLDLRLSKEFRLGGVGLTVGIDAFNVTNEQTILQRDLLINQTSRGTTRKAARADRMFEQQSPRVFRLGARLTF